MGWSFLMALYVACLFPPSFLLTQMSQLDIKVHGSVNLPPQTPTREITGGNIGVSNISERLDTMKNKVRHDVQYTRPFADTVRIGDPSR
jgi:hypothetical protein